MPLQSLIDSNTDAIEQLNDVLLRLDDEQYAKTICPIAVSTLGCHVRHIIEHYQSFFDGLDGSSIDYDARARDQRVEHQREVAGSRLKQLLMQLEAIQTMECAGDMQLEVRLQTQSNNVVVPATKSTLCRELVFLHGHTTHHFAQMALHMRAMGLEVGAEFGMAPSTQSYLQEERNSTPRSLSA